MSKRKLISAEAAVKDILNFIDNEENQSDDDLEDLVGNIPNDEESDDDDQVILDNYEEIEGIFHFHSYKDAKHLFCVSIFSV